MADLVSAIRTPISHFAIFGAGSFGTALAVTLARQGHRVTLIGRDEKTMTELNTKRENTRYLPGVLLHPNIVCTNDLGQGIHVDYLLLSVPTQFMRDACVQVRAIAPASFYKSTSVIHVAKGLERVTGKRVSEVILETLPALSASRLAVLSGPSHAEELAQNVPTTLVATSASKSYAEEIQDVFMSDTLRVYTNPDLIGVELGGALKNIIALGAGISDGLGFGDNARAALITRGLVEIARLGVALGASTATFGGLTGIGDLIVTCTSRLSRNWNAGYLLGQGMSIAEVLPKIGMVVEGATTTKVAVEKAKSLAVTMPIAEAISDLLDDNCSPREAVLGLMNRKKTHEVEERFVEASIGWTTQ
ncbi:NAD(P)H-dependent glycerol-3-phosphate dehydrogenase [Ferroacidibacillus organovorans]|uniref:Glycerol-3-phosphate dehydrogenase [NAD(P)+] n=1 Tax=Ferroacidibacillus organovorans TaxID=1765683 RepID=A0A853KCF6_9BACL|nr:NAD(P)H-dependent glycerol-3-phosphate dehydrogenase [Ferroacidibacillus organovorans]KYP80487.1 hypothetical protein AYJ22_02240 [Ferroacidibacillus organovorans]OAG94716.1 hypothetical protein AYW79_04010 [Ferroacidibacillus organovorans]